MMNKTTTSVTIKTSFGTVLVETRTPPAGSFSQLYVKEPSTLQIGRMYKTGRTNVHYLDLTGKGKTPELSFKDLMKKVKNEVTRLEKKADRRPSEDNRILLLKEVLLGQLRSG